MIRTRTLAAAAVAVAALGAATPAEAAKAPTFKADVYIHQSAEWAASWTTPEICGDGYRHFFRGDGQGSVTYQTRRPVIVKFKRTRGGGWTTNEFGMSGRLGRQAGYETGESGNPRGCLPDYVGIPDKPDTSECGGKDVSRSSKSFWLMVIGGRLMPAGAFSGPRGGDPFDGKCPDQTARTGIVHSVPSPQRRDLHKLIPDKRVRSISLTSGRSYIEETLGTEQMLFPGGDNHAGEGQYEGRWTIKLTRVR